MPEDTIIPARKDTYNGLEDIPQNPGVTSYKKPEWETVTYSKSETVIPPQKTETVIYDKSEVTQTKPTTVVPPRGIPEQKTPTEQLFKPKLSKTQFIIELAFVIFFFDLIPFGLTWLNLTGVLAIFSETTKWFLAFIAWLSINARALFLGVKLVDGKKMMASMLKVFLPPLAEITPILNGFIPGWTLQYILTFAPVTFDLQKIIKKGGTWAKYLALLPGIGTEAAVVLKTASKASERV